MTTIERLQAWYVNECDGDWEHGYAVKVETLDNPGWLVHVHLADTILEDETFQPVKVERSEHDWVQCFIRDRVFCGNGGPNNLDEVMRTFLDWADRVEAEFQRKSE